MLGGVRGGEGPPRGGLFLRPAMYLMAVSGLYLIINTSQVIFYPMNNWVEYYEININNQVRPP